MPVMTNSLGHMKGDSGQSVGERKSRQMARLGAVVQLWATL